MFKRLVLASVAAVAALAGAAAAQPYGRDRGGYGAQGGELVLFEHVDYRGRPLALRGEEPNLVPLGYNDLASSIRTRGAWEVCEDVYFQGRCWTVDGDQPNLVYAGFNDRISSARPLGRRGGRDRWDDRRDRYDDRGRPGPDRRARGGDPIVLYEHAGFGGRAAGINGDLSDLNSIGFNDRASSVQVNAGAWRLCSEAYGQGRCVIVDRDADLTQLGLNDQVSFVGRVR